MSLTFTMHPSENNAELPDVSQVSSASIVIFDGENVLWTHHKERGWDIPGGHIEESESILEALHREVREEVGATIENPVFVATISSNAVDGKYAGKIMCIFATKSFQLLDDWTPANDVDGRSLLEVNKAMKEYYGDVDGLMRIIELARKKI